jgi:regulator of sigma E protease
MTIILFILILGSLIFVHELGHFLAAKAFGIRVDEFAIGFPPKIIGFKVGETEYKINLTPLGGYVKIFGEDPDEESINGPESKRSFVNAKKWKQITVLLAGIFMNIVFAWILVSISFNMGMITAVGDEYKGKATNVSVLVLSVMKDSPSDIAGLKNGDNILAITSGKTRYENPDINKIQSIISESKSDIKVDYRRDATTSTVSIVPKDGVVDGKKAIGISMASIGTVKFGFVESFVEGAKFTVIESMHITKGIYNFIIGVFTGKSGLFSEVAGPIGIAGMVGEARHIGLSYLLSFVAMISLNLAVLNAVPFPALDGGRVLFVVIEIIIRKKIKPVIANWANTIGFGLLISLMIFVTYKDILKLFK